MIAVNNLTVTLSGHRVLDNVTFDIKRGETVAIIGPNGSGKTTLLKALLGLIPYEGSITIAERTAVGYVPQRLEFDRTMPVTVRELLAIHRQQQSGERISQVLQRVGIEHLADRRLGVLSGGEFQRVLVALALLNKPQILILDEPAAGIDVEGADEVYRLLQGLRQSEGLTILLVSHDVDVVFRYATNVLCINHRLVCSGLPLEALTKDTLEQLYGDHHTVYAHGGNHHA